MQQQSRTALAITIGMALGTTQASAATFSVDNTNDAGAGSLRDALAQANANGEADTIEMSAISGQTINVTSGALYSQDDEITIDGYDVTLDAGGNSTVLLGYYTDLTLNDLTVTGGYNPGFGGGIYSNYGDLELNNATVTGNDADVGGGVAVLAYGYQDVSINDSEISGNAAGTMGGGVLTYLYGGTISVQNSVISGNSLDAGKTLDSRPGWFELSERRLVEPQGGPRGGGIYLLSYFGTVEIDQSTISGNSAPLGAAGIAYGSTITIANSTISGNSGATAAGGYLLGVDAVAVNNSTVSGNSATDVVGGLGAIAGVQERSTSGDGLPAVTVQFTTITDNDAATAGGGLYAAGLDPTSLNGSVIAGNDAPADPDLVVPEMTTTNANFSLVGTAPSSGTFNTDATSGDLLGQDPLLGALADNGGPTQTHLPDASSPVLDVVADDGTVGCGTTFTTDQRGEPRPFGGGCDLGSVELGEGEALPPAPSIPALDRTGLLLLTGALAAAGLLGLRRYRADSAS